MSSVDEKKSKVLYEKYRPKTIDDIILPKRTKTSVTKWIKEGEIPCLIFYSVNSGVGKTSLAYIICEALESDYIYINSSLDNSIDILRSRIQAFATSMSISNRPKNIILDEFDGASPNFQEALRAFIENFEESCRVIITCNSLNKINKAIRSRCTLVNFDFEDDKTKNQMTEKMWYKIHDILEKEGISCDDRLLLKIIEKHFPDMRSMLNIIKDFADSNGNVITEEILVYNYIGDELCDYIINKKFTQAREYVIKGSFSYKDLYRFLYDKLIPKLKDNNKIAGTIMVISEFMWRESQGVIDSEINFAHCLLQLIKIM